MTRPIALALERSIPVVRTLVDAIQAGERPSAQVLHDYRAQCMTINRNVAELRVMLGSLKSQIPIH